MTALDDLAARMAAELNNYAEAARGLGLTPATNTTALLAEWDAYQTEQLAQATHLHHQHTQREES